jgi:hypothetical protein
VNRIHALIKAALEALAREYIPEHKTIPKNKLPPKIASFIPKLEAAILAVSKQLKTKPPKLEFVENMGYEGYFVVKTWSILLSLGRREIPTSFSKKDFEDLIDTVKHETVHAWQMQYNKRNVEDNSYHDKEFWKVAKSVGVKEKPFYD